MGKSLCLVFILYIMIHPGYFHPKPDLNIHLHPDGSKQVGDAQEDDEYAGVAGDSSIVEDDASGQNNRAIERKSNCQLPST